jgi:hypothetical protein
MRHSPDSPAHGTEKDERLRLFGDLILERCCHAVSAVIMLTSTLSITASTIWLKGTSNNEDFVVDLTVAAAR